jgi:hypothetical protein
MGRFIFGLIAGIVLGGILTDAFFPDGFINGIDHAANMLRDSLNLR